MAPSLAIDVTLMAFNATAADAAAAVTIATDAEAEPKPTSGEDFLLRLGCSRRRQRRRQKKGQM